MRPSPRTAARRRPALLGAVLVVLALSACTGVARAPDSYGTTTRDNFIKGCIQGVGSVEGADESLTANVEAICTCTYAGIVEKVPFSDFKEIDKEYRDDPGEVPPEMATISAECADDPDSYELKPAS